MGQTKKVRAQFKMMILEGGRACNFTNDFFSGRACERDRALIIELGFFHYFEGIVLNLLEFVVFACGCICVSRYGWRDMCTGCFLGESSLNGAIRVAAERLLWC